MSFALLLVLLVLAAHRVWRFLALDDLPGLVRVREAIEDTIANRHGSEWSDGLTCQWCSGWWVSCAVVGIVWALHPLPLPGLWFLAVASGVGFLGRWLED